MRDMKWSCMFIPRIHAGFKRCFDVPSDEDIGETGPGPSPLRGKLCNASAAVCLTCWNRGGEAIIYLLPCMLTHAVRSLFFYFFTVINTSQPVLWKDKLERPAWSVWCDKVDPGLPHKQAPICESLGLCVWPLNLQCGCSSGDNPGLLPFHPLHCRLPNEDDCVLKQFSVDSVQGTDAGLVRWNSVSGTTFVSTLEKPRRRQWSAAPSPLIIQGTKIEWVVS